MRADMYPPQTPPVPCIALAIAQGEARSPQVPPRPLGGHRLAHWHRPARRRDPQSSGRVRGLPARLQHVRLLRSPRTTRAPGINTHVSPAPTLTRPCIPGTTSTPRSGTTSTAPPPSSPSHMSTRCTTRPQLLTRSTITRTRRCTSYVSPC